MHKLICPGCRTFLSQRKTALGLVWVCPACRGRAITLQVVRRAVSQTVVNQLWQRARSDGHLRKRPCPACQRRMAEVPIAAGRRTEHLDVCTGCHFVWFDRSEFAALPKAPPKSADQEESLPLEAREALALARLEMVKRRQRAQREAEEGPDHWWEVIIAFLGVPVEHDAPPLEHRPWATWLTMAVIALVSILALRNLGPIVENWGLVPAEFGRHGGLTFVTSFFLHAGIVHLLGNLYFLWIFGDNTEDMLGPGRFLLLLVLASLFGDIAHILSAPASTTPAVGASGGISGVLAYYCLRFPRARIGLIVYFRWVRIPAWGMFAFWIILQILQAYHQHLGLSRVAAFAHLGGAAVGVAFWCLTRRIVARPSQTHSHEEPRRP